MPPPAHATFSLTIAETGGPSITVVDGGVGDLDGAANRTILFFGAVGDFNIDISAGTSNAPGTPNLAQLTINNTTISSLGFAGDKVLGLTVRAPRRSRSGESGKELPLWCASPRRRVLFIPCWRAVDTQRQGICPTRSSFFCGIFHTKAAAHHKSRGILELSQRACWRAGALCKEALTVLACRSLRPFDTWVAGWCVTAFLRFIPRSAGKAHRRVGFASPVDLGVYAGMFVALEGPPEPSSGRKFLAGVIEQNAAPRRGVNQR